MTRPISTLLFALALGGCGGDKASDDDSGTESAVDFDCDNYCSQGLADVEAAGCTNTVPSTQADIDSCVETCEFQIAVPDCGQLSADFWQCTLDEYPGNFTCDANGNPVQPAGCDGQQAVVDCMNGD